MTTPITPREVSLKKAETIPDYIITIINNLIVKSWNGNKAVIKQNNIIDAILSVNKNDPEIDRQYIFDNGYLNFETLFSHYGWDVEYDIPGFDETYPAVFIFTIKK